MNGQAGYLLLGVWPLVALAERARSHLLSGAGISAATVLAGLAVLGQTRAIVPAVVVSAVVLVAVLPGRRARVWALVAIAAGVVLAAGPLLDVFNSGAAGAGSPDPVDAQDGRRRGCWRPRSLVGAVWALLRWLGEGSSLGYGARPVARVSTIVLVAPRVGGGRGERRGGRQPRGQRPRAGQRVPQPRCRLHRRDAFALHVGRRQPLRLLADRLEPVRRRAAPGGRRRQLRPHLLPRAQDLRGHPPAPQPPAPDPGRAGRGRGARACWSSSARWARGSRAGPGPRAPATRDLGLDGGRRAAWCSSGWSTPASTGCT